MKTFISLLLLIAVSATAQTVNTSLTVNSNLTIKGGASADNLTVTNTSTLGTANITTANIATGHAGVFFTTNQILGATVDPAESTITLNGGTTTVDWSTAGQFASTMQASTTIAFSNQTNGMVRTFVIQNPSTYTITWPTVRWQGGVTPVQTTGGKGDIYTITYSRGTNMGVVVQNF